MEGVMSNGTPLAERMKGYEEASRVLLTRRMPMIVRVDGRAFHTFTRGMQRFSFDVAAGMSRVAEALMQEVPGAKLAYVQSDEVSLLVTDYDSLGSQPWFNKSVQKIASVAASIATVAYGQGAMFDARAFVIPREDVNNYFVWRQQDATRNSIATFAQAHFSHKELQGKSGDEMLQMVYEKTGLQWGTDLATMWKRGWTWVKGVDGLYEDQEVPIFTQDHGYVELHAYVDADMAL